MTLQRVNAQHVAKCSVSVCKVTFELRDLFSTSFLVFILILFLQRLGTKHRGGIEFHKK